MKYMLTVLALYFSYSVAAQDIGFKVKTAELLQDNSSVIEFGSLSMITKKQLEKWIDENSVSYPGSSSTEIMKGFIKVEYATRFVYGATHSFAKKLTFVKANQYNAYVAFWERQEQLQKERQERNEVIGTMIAIGGGYLLFKAGKAIVKGIGKTLSQSGTDYNSTNNKSETSSSSESNKDNSSNSQPQLVEIEINRSGNKCCMDYSESYCFNIYEDGKKSGSEKTIHLDKNNEWRSGCGGLISDNTFLGKTTYIEALKEYYYKYYKKTPLKFKIN